MIMNWFSDKAEIVEQQISNKKYKRKSKLTFFRKPSVNKKTGTLK